MRRRSAIISGLTALFFSSKRACADPAAARIPHIGLLSPQPPTLEFGAGFHEGLKELGYIEGQNIQIEYRWEQGRFDRLADYAKELVQLNVDVIVTVVTQASLAAQAATHTIPIVMVAVADPVGVGLVASLARPGGTSPAPPIWPPKSSVNNSN